MDLFRTKSVERSIEETDEPEHTLKKELSAWDLTFFGVGVVIGTGIFVLTGQQAHDNAGPAIVISFVLAGIACGLAALCYAEFASTVPVAGSAYTFSYATLGELIAWIIGWDLVLELALGAAVVARGWSAYLQDLFDLPTWLAGDDAKPDIGAIAIVLGLTVIGVLGTKLSGRFTGALVILKVSVVMFVVIAGLFFVKWANYQPFVPDSEPAAGGKGADQTLLQGLFGVDPTAFGAYGIIAAASVVFFAYIGFDIVATSAEETKNPQRDVPRGILGSLAICTVLYMLVSFVITGMLKYSDDRMSTAAPLAEAFDANGAGWASKIISTGAVAGLTTVVLVLMLGQARVLFAMSRDGLLPVALAKVHPRFGTPVPDHDHHGPLRGGPGRRRAAVGAVQARQHRHVVRVRAGLGRRHHPAPHSRRPAPPVPGAGRPVGPGPVDPGVPVADGESLDRDVGAVPRLARDRVRRLLPLRLPRLPAGQRASSRRRPRRTQCRPSSD